MSKLWGMPPSLKQKLRSGAVTIGSWIAIGHPAIAEIMAKAGFDWLTVDLEHSTISTQEAGELIRVIALCGVAPLVRLTSNDPNQIKRVMDAGAHGIVVPNVSSPEDAEAAVRGTRYGPRGVRGVGLGRAQGYGATFGDYLKWQEAEPVVLVQIEHRDGVANADAILSIDGVDGFILGPYDLSCSLGLAGRLDAPEVTAAMEAARVAGERVGKPSGIHIVEPDHKKLRGAIDAGFRLIAYSVDFRMLDVAAREGVMVAREALS